MTRVLVTIVASLIMMSYALITTTVNANQVTPVSNVSLDGAFRDGLYLGKLDAVQNRQPHLSSGRWSSDRDRASFIAGYETGYGQAKP